MHALTFSGYTAHDIIRDLDVKMATGFQPNVALVFQAPGQNLMALSQSLDDRGIQVVGATTSGEIEGATVLEESCVMMAFELAPDTFASCLFAGEEDMEQKAQQLGQFATSHFEHPIVFAFASGIGIDGNSIVRGVQTGAGRDITLFGGMAADELQMNATHVFTGKNASDQGLIGLVLDGNRYEATGLSTSGWQSVGVEKVVTHSEGNVVHTIDDEPALNVYEQYFEVDGTSVAMDIGVQYPLLITRDNGDSVIRAPLMTVGDTPSLLFAGGVPQGARVKFCIPPSLEVVEHVVEEASAMQNQVPDADALVLISCAARLTALGPMVEDEVQGVFDLWNVPMVGFFSYGEIGPTRSGDCDFHNETCTLVALREIAN